MGDATRDSGLPSAGPLFSQGPPPPPPGNYPYQRPTGYRRQVSAPVTGAGQPISNPFGHTSATPSLTERISFAPSNMLPTVAAPGAYQRPPVHSMQAFRTSSAGSLPSDSFSFVQPTYERKQQEEDPLTPISPQSAVPSALPVTSSFLSGPHPSSLVHSHLMPSSGGGPQFVQSNSYAAYGAENDPEQTPSNANAFSAKVPATSDVKLASFFGGFGPMSPSQGKDFFDSGPSPVNAAVLASEIGNKPSVPQTPPVDQALVHGHNSDRTEPMDARPPINNDWERITPTGNAVGDTTDAVQGYVADPKKQDIGDSQHASSGMPTSDHFDMVTVGARAFNPTVTEFPVAVLTQTNSHGSGPLQHEVVQEQRKDFASNWADQLSDRFAEQSLVDHQPIPHQLPENQQESFLLSVSAPAGALSNPVYVGPVTAPFPVSQVQPEHTAPETDQAASIQPVMPLVGVPAGSQFQEQPYIAGRSLMYFPNISPPGEQAEQNVGGQAAATTQLSGQSQVLTSTGDSQSQLPLLDLSVPQVSRPSEISLPHTVSSESPVVSSGVVPVTATSEFDMQLSTSLPVSGSTTVYHGSEPKTDDRPVMQDTLPPDVEESVSTPHHEQYLSQPLEPTAMLSGGLGPQFLPTLVAQAEKTATTDGLYQVSAAGLPQTAVLTVLQADGQYHSPGVVTESSLSIPNAAIFSGQSAAETEQFLMFQAPVTANNSSQVAMRTSDQQPVPEDLQSAVPEALVTKGGHNPAVVVQPSVQAASYVALKSQHEQPSSLQPAVATSAVTQVIVSNALVQQTQQLSTANSQEIQAQQTVPTLSMVSQMSSLGVATHQSGIPQSTVSGGVGLPQHQPSHHQIQPVAFAGLAMSQSSHLLQHPVSAAHHELQQIQFQAESQTAVLPQGHPYTAVRPPLVSSVVTPSQTLQSALVAAPAVQSQQLLQPDANTPVASVQSTMCRQTGNAEPQPLVVSTQTTKVQQDMQPHLAMSSLTAASHLGRDQQMILQSRPQEAFGPQGYQHATVHPTSAAFQVNPLAQQTLQSAVVATPAAQSQHLVQPEVRMPPASTQLSLPGSTIDDHAGQQPLSMAAQARKFQQDTQFDVATTSTGAVTHVGSNPPSSTPSLQDSHLQYDEHPSMYHSKGQSFLVNRSHPSAFHEPVRPPVHALQDWPPGYQYYSGQYPSEREMSGHYGGYRGYGNEYYNHYYDHDHYRHRHYGRYDPYSNDRHYRSYHHHPDDEQRWREHYGYRDYHDHYRHEADGHSRYDSRYYSDQYHGNYQSEYENRSAVETEYQPDVSSIHGGDDNPALESTTAAFQDVSQYADYDGHQQFDPHQHYDGSFMDPATTGFYTADAPWQPVQRTPSPPPRATPAKFNRPHVVARFNFRGQLVTVLPQFLASDRPRPVEISEPDAEVRNKDITQMSSFPGPLLRDETSRAEIVAFGSERAAVCRKSAKESDDLAEKESLLSSAVLWDYLILLCRQNGAVDGSDVSNLLMQQSELPLEQPQHSCSENYGTETQYRNLLLSGRKKQALETAVRGQLWGHAFVLASRMDSRVQNSVMTRFVESCRSNDPLQTYYLLQSGRQPIAVKGTSDPSWGDWKPHIAMMMANKSSDEDLRNIMIVSENLASRDVCGSHLCYLLAGGRISYPGDSRCRVALLGANHMKPLREYVTVEPIQRTEVYEYACSLNDINFCCPALQCFKLLYAYWLLESGFLTKALQYCEAISQSIRLVPGKFTSSFVSQLYELSCQLHSNDTHSRTMYHDELPEWLSSLENILGQREDHTIRTAEASPFPFPADGLTGQRTPAMEGYMPAENFEHLQTTENMDDMRQSTQTLTYDQQPGAALPPLLGQQPYSGSGHSSLTGSRTDLFTARGEQPQQYQFQGFGAGEDVPSYGQPMQFPSVPSGVPYGMADTNALQTFVPQETQYSWGGFSGGDSAAFPSSSTGTGQPLEPAAMSGIGTEASSQQQQHEQNLLAQNETRDDVSESEPKTSQKKESKQSGESKSLLGRLWQKFRPSGNQMNLPDDKNKSILWDDKLKKWVDSEGTEEETSGPAAPPTDFQLQSQGIATASAQMNSVGGVERVGALQPGDEQDGSMMPKTSGNAYSRVHAGPKGRLGARTKYVDVLNPGGSANSTTQSSFVAPPAIPGFANPLPSQPFSGTLFVPQPSGGNTSDDFGQPQSDATEQTDFKQSSEWQTHAGYTNSGHQSGPQMPPFADSLSGNSQGRGPTPDRMSTTSEVSEFSLEVRQHMMSTTSEVSEFSLEVRQHMGYLKPTDQFSDQSTGQIPMYSSSGPPPSSHVHHQSRQPRLSRLPGARPRYGTTGTSSKPPSNM